MRRGWCQRLMVAVCLTAASAAAQAGIDVRIRGLGSDEAGNAYAQIGLLDYARKIDSAKGTYDPAEVQRRFDQGELEIQEALQPFGWYKPTIKSELKGKAPDWTATYTVDAGPQTTIDKVEIVVEGDGKDSEKIKKVLARPHVSSGERLKHTDYEDLKSRLAQAANSDGYLDASFSRHELRVDIDANRADILLTLNTGPRWYFGEATIEQDAGLNEHFLHKYLKLAPGAPFDSAAVLTAQFALTDLDYFKSVEIEPHKEKAGADHRIPLLVRAKAKPKRAYKFGAGYGTDTGPRALAGVEFRRLNEEGHKLRLELRPSQRISSATAEYRIPFGTNPGDNISLTAQGLKQDFDGIAERLVSFGTAWSRQTGSWERRLYLTYTNDNYSLPNEPGTNSKLLTPGMSWSRTDVNNPIYPRRGWFFSADVHGGTRKALSDTDFLETLVQLRGVLPLTSRARVLARAQEGMVVSDNFVQLPPSQRFFAGGEDSVRGYPYRALAPTDSFGNIVGGRYLTTASVEADIDVYKTYGLAVFADSGGAADALNPELHYAAGLGFRYRAPFGSIAIDFAHPFDAGAPLVHLDIGVKVGL